MSMSKVKRFFVILASVGFLLGCAAHGSCLTDLGLGEAGCECAQCTDAGECTESCETDCKHREHLEH